jgi:hypothetical protein
VLGAVLSNGIPGLSTAAAVFDESTGKVWTYGASGWAAAPARSAAGLGVIAYSATSSDSARAAVSVEFRCGPGCDGGAYDFVLQKARGQWKVQSIFPAWRG